MYSYNKPNKFSIDFYIQPEIVSIPETPKEEPKKVLEKMNEPKPEDRLEKDSKIVENKRVEKEEPIEKEQKEHKYINKFETLKNKFLNVKNKPLFIKRNKDKIKSLIAEEQKEFIKIAKSYFENV